MTHIRERKMKRLSRAVAWSRGQLRQHRQHRLAAIQQYVGHNYAGEQLDDSGRTLDKVPINLIELTINILIQQLAARAPKALCSTPHRKLKVGVSKLQLALNHLSDEIDLERTFQRAVLDACFGMGITKTALAASGQVVIDDATHDVGMPYCDAIHIDDWVHDCEATDFRQVQFCGNRYRLPIDIIRDEPTFKKRAANRVVPHPKQITNDDEEGGGDERAESITQDSANEEGEFHESADLLDLYLPIDNLILTVEWRDITNVLSEREWTGPESGPYDVLRLIDVPNNVYPLPPVASMMDMHILVNALYNKLGRQAERQKTLLGVTPGGKDDGDRIVNASDGEAILMERPGDAKEYRFGGVDPQNMAFVINALDRYSWSQGNLESLGGLGPQAETASQDQMLLQSASKRIQAMQHRVARFAQGVMQKLGWYLWHDPLIELPLVRRVGKTDIPITFSPQDREGDFFDMNIKIEPYSMQYQPPAARLATLTQVFQQFLVPFAGQLQAQGAVIDMKGLLKKIGELANLDELSDIVQFVGQTDGEQAPSGGEARQSPATTRTNVRINRPGVTQGGKDAAMAGAILGGGLNPGQQASMARRVG